jgi:molybdopterin/thiamine biosynthesis adenylyltransferase
MSQKQIDLSSDLRRLQNEGYEIEVRNACLIIRSVPYVNASREIARGILISPLAMSGDVATYNGEHVIYFAGDEPCDIDGIPISSIKHDARDQVHAGITCNYSFSNKPPSGYANYYEKATNYINIISAPACAIDETCTAKTFRVIESPDESPYVYEDTNSSRAGLYSMNEKLRKHRIAIIGLGGTGSYLLDLLAKCPVGEIHLFDGDIFLQHNAFRAPGAPSGDIFNEQLPKTEYYADIYGHMKRNVVSHPYYLNENNVSELSEFDFVFLCLDASNDKKGVISTLVERHIQFIDTGVSVTPEGGALNAQIRNTSILNPHAGSLLDTIAINPGDENDPYSTNIQIAEINVLCAVLAVIKWKKVCGFYIDLEPHDYLVYDINDGEIKYAD